MWRLLNIFFYSSTKRKQHKIKVDHLQSESFSYNKLSKDNMHRLCPLQLLRGSKHEEGGWLYTCLPIFCCLNVKQCPWLSPWRPAHCVNVYLLFSFKYHSRNWDLPQSPVPFPLTWDYTTFSSSINWFRQTSGGQTLQQRCSPTITVFAV